MPKSKPKPKPRLGYTAVYRLDAHIHLQDKRIAELETENEQLKNRLQFLENERNRVLCQK